MFIWTLLGIYAVPYVLEHWRERRKNLQDRARALERLDEVNRGLAQPNLDEDERRSLEGERQKLRKQQEDLGHQALGQTFEVGVSGGLVLVFFVVGIGMLAAVLPTWKILALLAGFAAIGAAAWMRRRFRRLRGEWRQRAPQGRAAEGGHGGAVLLHLLGVPALLALGLFLLVSIF
ncbi:MAG TPA: hypothetical protein VFJ84_01350 [Candidatus Saccharimonadales bacterium]|nr:hypothetical protein [Candidatus Saccharimonadales bacterium]